MAYHADFSSDGRYLAFASRGDIWARPAGGGESFPVAETPALEHQPQLSPNAKWIAYTSTETSRAEVYVQSFPNSGSRVVVSTEGGEQARWGPSDEELFYVDPAGRLMGVSIDGGPAPQLSRPRVVIETPIVRGATRHHYAVASDGERLLVSVPEQGARSLITVALGWTSALPDAAPLR